jgi:prepilin-type processing-associated H-X9-DG protein
MNAELYYYSHEYYKNITKFKSPSDTAYLMDGTNHWLSGYAFNAASNVLVYGVGSTKVTSTRYWARHNKSIDVLFLDGHSKNRSAKSLPNSGPTLLVANHEVKIFWRGH